MMHCANVAQNGNGCEMPMFLSPTAVHFWAFARMPKTGDSTLVHVKEAFYRKEGNVYTQVLFFNIDVGAFSLFFFVGYTRF